jgi:hypothetical protein
VVVASSDQSVLVFADATPCTYGAVADPVPGAQRDRRGSFEAC